MNAVRRVALTAGEPAGIGPDLCISLAQRQQSCQLVVIADPALLSARAEILKLPLTLIPFDVAAEPTPSQPGQLYFLPAKLAEEVVPGQLNPANAPYVVETLSLAASGCKTQLFDAVVTAPVHKGVINDAGIVFSGHTEFFAEHADVDKVVMMLATPGLRVALATTHLPLRAVSDAITQDELVHIIHITHRSLIQQFGIDVPRIAVCGLNPHAGESGHLGREEIEVIEPAIARCVSAGIKVSGPWPADTLFVKDRLSTCDVVLAMYHDQGLPVLKHQGFGQAVNITLGLPYIRTSVDHGTALELAATGHAKVSSLQAAVDMALFMTEQHS